MDTKVFEEMKQQLLEISGMLTIADLGTPDQDSKYFVQRSNAQIVGLIKGLEIILDNQPITKETFNNELHP